MADFQNPPIQLDVTFGNQNLGAMAAFPTALQILVSGARQIFPTEGNSVNTLIMFAGTARFGQDQEEVEDPENVNSEDLEIDEGALHTLQLQLRVQQQQFVSGSSVGSATVTTLGSVGLDTGGVFGCATSNALSALTATNPAGEPLQTDFWLFSDVFAEQSCNLNRLGYQATLLLETGSLATPTLPQTPVPHQGDVIDLDVQNPNQVVSPGALDAGIKDGLQIYCIPPAGSNSNGANRLLIFTGTALCNVVGPTDHELFSAVVRVRLRFPVPPTLTVKGSAVVAALASVHSNDENPALLGVNAAKIVTDPTDGGSLPQPPQPLPDNEVYLLAELRAYGEADGSARPGVSRFAYQANVLVQDTLPELDSILVRPSGEGAFGPQALLTIVASDVLYDIQLNLTGPLPPNSSLEIGLTDTDPQNVLVSPLIVVTAQSTVILNNLVLTSAPVELATITATGRRVTRTASLQISHLT